MNSLRLMYSRLASHRCPNGHYVPPTLKVAAEQEIICPECGERVHAPSAEQLAFNSQGACPKCGGTGSVRTVDLDSLVPDDSISIDEGAVAPWNSLMWSLMTDVCREMGVRTDIPFKDLTDEEKDIVYHGPAEKKHIIPCRKCPVCDGTGQISLDVQFLPDVDVPCPECGGSRYAKEAWQIHYENKKGKRYSLPELMGMDVNMAIEVTEDLKLVHQRLEVLKNLGLGYLTLGEETPSLSGGEAQRLKLASEMGKGQSDSVFVFDEPTIGLHPLDVQTLLGVFQSLVDKGATVIVIEHDLDIISNADYIIDMGPGGGEAGGRVVATGTPEQIAEDNNSFTGRFLSGNCA